MSDNPMHRLTYGLFVLTARHRDKANGCIINTGIQVANTPDRIAIAVNKANYTHDMIKQTGQFVISVLSEKASFDTFKRFGFQSGKDVDKFDGFKDCRYLPNGIPYITAGTNAYFSIKVTETTDFGSHTLFVGTIEKMEVLSNDASATYDYYQNNIKPKPEDAAKKSENSLPPGMHKWRCKICGFEYIGETLPEDYICEICKHPASDFELVE
jgi:flavin reductase (DIM6/NTAB) family NADH-FMN oxidoreductase RutF/rubredoxin